jgi:hypothetical protein
MIPPRNFRPANNVVFAKITDVPSFCKISKYTGRRRAGVLYEKKAQAQLCKMFDNYVPGFWIKFVQDNKVRYCQPDGLLFDLERGVITICEIKLQHTSDAWWQVMHLYAPVLRALFPEKLWTFEYCEIVQWFDSAIPFPTEIHMVSDPSFRSSKFKIHIWRP